MNRTTTLLLEIAVFVLLVILGATILSLVGYGHQHDGFPFDGFQGWTTPG